MNRKQRRAAQSQNKALISYQGATYTIEEASNLAVKSHNSKKLQTALEIYDLILAQISGSSDLYSNRAHVLHLMRRFGESLVSYDKAISLNSDNVSALYNRGLLLHELKRYEEALTSFEKAALLKPNIPYIDGFILSARMQICKWQGIEELFKDIASKIETGKPVASPFDIIAVPLSAAQQKQCAEILIKNSFPETATPLVIRRDSHDKIRIGYFSADFYNHATAYLTAELFEIHDRSKFEVIGFSFGPPSSDAMRQRLEKSFDRFFDVSVRSDLEIAQMARDMEIDIAVDLKGVTTNSRTGIFAQHVAPIQVNYLGYPVTMGARYIDYIFADSIVIPEKDRQFYTEKIVYLPDSYQVNDSKRRISDKIFTRKECGLPEQGFIFCCFNRSYKITPDIFDIWMRLLHKVEGSVLWLFVGNKAAAMNILKEANIRGIQSQRLVFAGQMDLADHLARHRLADLFLDTFYCNAHTTASDALWAGLPLLTCIGETFAARVSASLLNAIGLPELVTHSHAEYEAVALELATNPQKLSAIRQKLAQNRINYPLFNTKRYTKYIEEAYMEMWERYQARASPDHIYISASLNA